MVDSFTIYQQQQASKRLQQAEVKAYDSLDQLLAAEPGMQKLQYIQDLTVFDEKSLREEPIAVVAARIGEDRAGFLAALLNAGVESISDRQMFTNGIARCVREGRIGRGWAKPPPEECTHCGKLPATGKKLLTCG